VLDLLHTGPREEYWEYRYFNPPYAIYSSPYSPIPVFPLLSMQGYDWEAPYGSYLNWWMVDPKQACWTDYRALPPGLVVALKHSEFPLTKGLEACGRDPARPPAAALRRL